MIFVEDMKMIVTLVHHLKSHTNRLGCCGVYRFLHNETPITRYSAMLQKGALNADKEQFQAVLKLQELHNDIKDYEPNKRTEKLDVDVSPSIPKGLYLHGGVGSGKTLLMDLFYDSVGTTQKKRAHFHSFMLYIYSEINRWNLCVDEDIDFVTPMEYVANKIMKDTWLLCFDEIQLADYASCTLLNGVFSHMLSNGAVIVGTSNRAPRELGDLSITDHYDGDLDGVEDTVGAFASVFEKNCRLHHLNSERDHRMELNPGENRYLCPSSEENSTQLDNMFANVIQPSLLGSSVLELYNRKILIPLSAGTVARFSFNDLCCQPLGPADYIKICNNYQTIFVDNVPKLNMNTKSEARRFIIFIDAVYESRVQLYCSATAAPEDLFLMLPRDDNNYEPEQMHMEMLGEIAYDLKIAGLDFKSLNILSGKDEIFSFKRAISRLKEFQSAFYQSCLHRQQEFLPYLGSQEEVDTAELRRDMREKRRRKKIKELEDEKDTDPNEDGNDPAMERSFKETDWGDEASYITFSKEVSEMQKTKRGRHDMKKDDDGIPIFGDQHFWGMGWWEKVREKWKPRSPKNK